jgi:uncharacterized protein (DUF1501 family)
MPTSRRDFLRQTGCLLGTAALASTFDSLGLINAYAQTTAADYRALVCIFLNGGNDGNNMVVPLDAEYTAYQNVRGASTLALTQASLLPVNPMSGRQFGFHPNMPEMQSLFNQGKVGVVCNVGPLVEPLTRATYQNGTGKKPLQLFSHSDQVGLWQTSTADTVSQTGWGGRTADRTAVLNGAATFPQVISIAGISLFATGLNTRPLAISDSRTSLSSVLPLSNAPGATTTETNARRASLDALRTYDQSALLVKAASDVTSSALQTRDALISANVTLQTNFPDTTLGFQLEQVAKLIALRNTLGIKRQIFFVSLGGFDTHSNQRGAGQDTLLQQVSQAMSAFYASLVELSTTLATDVTREVTAFTISDFGRTFQPAGSGSAVGSDHGWGNHQLIMGGAVRGNDFYGRFPTLALSGPDDADSRGRWIPSTSVEQYAATLGTWYGLSSSDLPAVFPLIGRFPTANLGFML